MQEITNRLGNLVFALGSSVNAFAKNIGVDTANMNKMIKGQQSITKKTINKILVAYPQVSEDWLINGVGEMFEKQPLTQVHNSNVNYHSPHATIYAGDVHTTIQDIPTTNDAAPLVPIELTRKENTDIYNEMMRKNELTSEHITKVNVFSEIDFYFMVCDDAMSPNFVRGDYIALRHLEPGKFIINGYPYVLDTKTHGMFLRILKERPDHYECSVVSQSERYEAFDVPKEDVYMVYNVKGLVRTSF